MWKKSKVTDQTATSHGAGIKKMARLAGVMIIQCIEQLPEGKSTPDFLRKPVSLTIQEGKLAIFKASVCGDPTPEVTWGRTKGDMSNTERFLNKYDRATGEHTLEITSVSEEDTGTYKCYATNKYGRAVCNAALNVIGVGFKKKSAIELLVEEKGRRRVNRNFIRPFVRPSFVMGSVDPTEFRKLLRKRKSECKQEAVKEPAEVDGSFWKIIMNADRKDYERICSEFGVKDFRLILKKLNEKKKNTEEKQAKDGVMSSYTEGDNLMQSFRRVGNEKENGENAGLYQVDVGKANPYSTDRKTSTLDFLVKFHEVKAKEREDALFECLLSHPFPRMKWMGKNATLEDGEKYTITVSENKLIHRLLIKDCSQLDKGIYSAAAGIKICSAWLIVEADSDPALRGKKKARKTTQAGGTGLDLEKLSQEQEAKLAKERKALIEAANKAREERMAQLALLAPSVAPSPPEDEDSGKGKGTGERNYYSKGGSNKSKAGGKSVSKLGSNNEGTERKRDNKNNKKYSYDSEKNKGPNGGCGAGETEDYGTDFENGSVQTRKGQMMKDKLIDPDRKRWTGETEFVTDSENSSVHTRHGQMMGDKLIGSNGRSWTGETDEFVTDSENCSVQTGKDKLIDPNGRCWTRGTDEFVTDSENSSVQTRHGQMMRDKLIGPNGRSGTGETEDYGTDSENNSVQTRHDEMMKDKLIDRNEQSGRGEIDEYTDTSSKHSIRTSQGSLLKDTVIERGVQFVSGLLNTNAVIGQPAELTCKLSRDNCQGVWYKDGKKLTTDDRHKMSIDGPSHKLVINHCQAEDSGKYRFEADGRKTEAIFQVEDPPRFDPDDLSAFSQPVIVKAGNCAIFTFPFVGCEPIKIQWYGKGEELLDNQTTKMENTFNQSRLLLNKCQRKDTGEIKIKLKNEYGTMEAFSRLIVLEKPSVPQGPVEVLESTAFCISIKWRAPKDDGGCPVIRYNLERQQVGRNTWKIIGETAGVPDFEDKSVERGKKYRYRIRAVTEEGISEMMETDNLTAGTLAYPVAPPQPTVESAFDDCINLTWSTPTATGGSHILGYNVEKRKTGSNVWSPVNPTDKPIKENKCAVKDVVAGHEYEFRVYAINISGLSEPSAASEFTFARDPKKPPGKVRDLKVTDTSYTTLSLSWNKPIEEVGVQDEAKGYFIEIRQADCLDWTRCNVNPVFLTIFTVKGLRATAMYWVRVTATNDGGDGMPQELDNSILAMPPPVRPRFTDNKRKAFMVVRAGNSVRILLNFEASPCPDVIWLKDNVPVLKRVNISNSESSSQLLITSSERSDSGIYTILLKNLVGQEGFSVEVRVTDDPKPPGPVDLEENVPGTVTVNWEPSVDEKRDDHLYYSVSKWDSSKGSWSTVADRLFNNKFTACNILSGREYHFRVYAKNDMGMSAPSESPRWGSERKKEKFTVNLPAYKTCDMQTAPAFLVPLKQRTAPKGYECHMSCAIKGNPKPRVTWYRNNISLNTDTNYLITNTCGVCSLLILRVTPRDWGEYTIEIESALGRAACSSTLTVRE
ncbi:hypothetical protein DPEC_G00010360 [Dallia pectoralis]|uniref:Uncharacterized protein n=1 Tax=Dallia pectoralis TaxID=75939 RepID=A0ACC2HLA4_DALPE|nr:hypothetical protein DPEC_G00010360 [Dallia pectoralis]